MQAKFLIYIFDVFEYYNLQLLGQIGMEHGASITITNGIPMMLVKDLSAILIVINTNYFNWHTNPTK